MSNWTHVNCCVRGNFDKATLVRLFGEPTIQWCEIYKYESDTKEYKELLERVIASHEQSKLPCGEEPLHWRLYSPDQLGGNAFAVGEDVLTITGDLRDYYMDEEGIANIEKICQDLLKGFEYGVRQLTMQAYEEYSGKEWIWSSVFNSPLRLKVWEPKERK